MHRLVVVVVVVAVVALGPACGDDHGAQAPTDGADVTDSGPVSSCDPPGHFGGAPINTFVLPTSSSTGFGYVDVQAAFPQVDWQTLDRLYLPAGRYTNIEVGNLPVRTPDRPLVITNHGGQFFIGDNPTGNYLWSFHGGANWILTGRYDADSQTGDAAFPGHACGKYADAAGTYGIVSDDAYAFAAPYLHMGIAVSDATDFELEYVEVARSGFAGIRLLNDAAKLGTNRPMANVKVHDTYIHDTAGEGYYFGWTGAPPSNLQPHLEIYNNRIVRTGNEALQIQDLGDGSHVHHNTFISGGLRWLDNGLGRYQDNNAQVHTRTGTIELDHNVFIDGAGTLLSFFSAPQAGDGPRHVRFHDNYFSDAISLGAGTSNDGSTFEFTNNTFRALQFAYTPVDPAATDPGIVVGRNPGIMDAVTFTANHWAGSKKLINPAGNVTTTDNVNDTPPTIEFVGGVGVVWSSPGHHLTSWAPIATVADTDPAVTYHPGDVVTYGAIPTLYRCTTASGGATPVESPAAWIALPTPSDDVRVLDTSPYATYGVR
ncbi:MAG: right-handed parallel beta-helix repeat-containing protein [Proteobacteria bacterium]|nr:right-handed parallel beta-helix repeat-containing protein [Pseudomonadota bacterium]